MKEKIKKWWNKPITNGDIVSAYVKSAIVSYVGARLLCHYIDKKFDSVNDNTTVDVSFETNEE